MKRLDELDLKRQADAEWTGETYSSKFEGQWIPPEYRNQEKPEQYAIEKRTLRWSEFKRMQTEEMLQHVQGKVFPFLKDLNGAESNFTHHMKNAVFIIPKPALLVEAVKTIDEIFAVMEHDSQEKGQAFQDIQGDVYEMLLSEIATAGKNGQFRTPRHIIKLMVALMLAVLGLIGLISIAIGQCAELHYPLIPLNASDIGWAMSHPCPIYKKMNLMQ